MFKIYAYNVETLEYNLLAGGFASFEDACEFYGENEIEWDETDVISEWQILVCEGDSLDGQILVDFTFEEEWDDSDEGWFDEVGFDPYMGCYSFDC